VGAVVKDLRCDICGMKAGDEFDLRTLTLPVKRAPSAEIPDIEHACGTCVKRLDDVNENMRRAMDEHRKSFMREFIVRLWRAGLGRVGGKS
jgi:hypothetical protein